MALGARAMPTTPQREPGWERPAPSRRSQRGLDWFTFFLANVQTGLAHSSWST